MIQSKQHFLRTGLKTYNLISGELNTISTTIQKLDYTRNLTMTHDL